MALRAQAAGAARTAVPAPPPQSAPRFARTCRRRGRAIAPGRRRSRRSRGPGAASAGPAFETTSAAAADARLGQVRAGAAGGRAASGSTRSPSPLPPARLGSGFVEGWGGRGRRGLGRGLGRARPERGTGSEVGRPVFCAGEGELGAVGAGAALTLWPLTCSSGLVQASSSSLLPPPPSLRPGPARSQGSSGYLPSLGTLPWSHGAHLARPPRLPRWPGAGAADLGCTESAPQTPSPASAAAGRDPG